MAEQRQEFRVRTSGLAKIVIADGDAPVDCVVHDISGAGGCIEVERSIQLPETFDLIPEDGDSSGYPCRVVWRKETLVGIQFVE
jgi:PilZ domain